MGVGELRVLAATQPHPSPPLTKGRELDMNIFRYTGKPPSPF